LPKSCGKGNMRIEIPGFRAKKVSCRKDTFLAKCIQETPNKKEKENRELLSMIHLAATWITF
jgi:hypothetical protein